MGRSHAANSNVGNGVVVKHYGVKGMHWGVRKAESSGVDSSPVSTPRPRISADARAVEKAFDKIDRGGTDVLSNNELQGVVTRLNLEQQYHRLTTEPATQQKNPLVSGHDAVKQMLGVGKTVNDAIKFANSPAGKFLKGAFMAAKVGVNLYTKGPVGTAVDIIRPKNHFTNVGR